AAFAAIDAADNATALLSAYGAPEMANPVDLCAVHQLILKAALAETGPAADEMVRYLVEFGWIN
nr:hypothetical protein [Paracoccaceae bacterium]